MLRNSILPSLLALSMLMPVMGADCNGTVPGTADNSNISLDSRTEDPNENRGDIVGDEQASDEPANNVNDNVVPAVDENEAAVKQVVEFLNSKVLTEISSSSNIGDISFIEQFRGDLELCSNKSFDYFEFKETTIGSVFSRTEFSAKGTWDVRIDSQTNQALLLLNFQTVSEGEPFNSEPPIEQNAAGETFLGGKRVFVTDGDDICQ